MDPLTLERYPDAARVRRRERPKTTPGYVTEKRRRVLLGKEDREPVPEGKTDT